MFNWIREIFKTKRALEQTVLHQLTVAEGLRKEVTRLGNELQKERYESLTLLQTVRTLKLQVPKLKWNKEVLPSKGMLDGDFIHATSHADCREMRHARLDLMEVVTTTDDLLRTKPDITRAEVKKLLRANMYYRIYGKVMERLNELRNTLSKMDPHNSGEVRRIQAEMLAMIRKAVELTQGGDV